jgi:hypothetical protein
MIETVMIVTTQLILDDDVLVGLEVTLRASDERAAFLSCPNPNNGNHCIRAVFLSRCPYTRKPRDSYIVWILTGEIVNRWNSSVATNE